MLQKLLLFMYQNTLIQSKRIKKYQKRQTHVKYLLYISNCTNPIYWIKNTYYVYNTHWHLSRKKLWWKKIFHTNADTALIRPWFTSEIVWTIRISLYKNALSLVRRKYSTLMFIVVGYQVIRKKRKFLALLWIKVFIAGQYDIKFVIIIIWWNVKALR